MRKVLMGLMLTVPAAVLAAGRTRGVQSARSLTDEQQIVDLSRRFADENVVNSAPAVKRVFAAHPKRIVAAKDGEADPLRMDQVRVGIDGDRAELTSRLVYSGRRSSGETYERSDRWAVRLMRRHGQWEVVGARLSATGK